MPSVSVNFGPENIVLRSILSLIFLLALSPGIQTYLRRVVSLHIPSEGDDKGTTEDAIL